MSQNYETKEEDFQPYNNSRLKYPYQYKYVGSPTTDNYDPNKQRQVVTKGKVYRRMYMVPPSRIPRYVYKKSPCLDDQNVMYDKYYGQEPTLDYQSTTLEPDQYDYESYPRNKKYPYNQQFYAEDKTHKYYYTYVDDSSRGYYKDYFDFNAEMSQGVHDKSMIPTQTEKSTYYTTKYYPALLPKEKPKSRSVYTEYNPDFLSQNDLKNPERLVNTKEDFDKPEKHEKNINAPTKWEEIFNKCTENCDEKNCDEKDCENSNCSLPITHTNDSIKKQNITLNKSSQTCEDLAERSSKRNRESVSTRIIAKKQTFSRSTQTKNLEKIVKCSTKQTQTSIEDETTISASVIRWCQRMLRVFLWTIYDHPPQEKQKKLLKNPSCNQIIEAAANLAQIDPKVKKNVDLSNLSKKCLL